MKVLRTLLATAALLALTIGVAGAGSISMKLSGEGAVNDSTIKAGQPVSIDIYAANDSIYTGFSFGFALKSPDIKEIVHVADSGAGLNEKGDIKGYNGWQDHSIWDFGGVFTVERDWNGKMPELLGFGGLCVKNEYQPHENQKILSFDLIVPEAGTLVIDSAFYPPGGRWLMATPSPDAVGEPDWLGPYTFKVVK